MILNLLIENWALSEDKSKRTDEKRRTLWNGSLLEGRLLDRLENERGVVRHGRRRYEGKKIDNPISPSLTAFISF
jgi:hypothetical protein